MTCSKKLNMHRKFIALVLAVAVTITGFSTAPARADEDVAKVIFGLTALAILGAAINENRKQKENAATRNVNTYNTGPDANWGRKVGNQQRRHNGWQQPRPLPDQVARFRLPAQCERAVSGRPNRSALGLRCLKKNYSHLETLPAACRVEFHNGRKYNRGYGTRCLRKRGYRLSFR